MYWLDNDSGVTTPPAIPPVASATRKWFTEGGAGEQPSWPGGEWFNMMTDELLQVLTLGGIAPDKADHTQLAKAIQAIAFSAAPVGSPLPWPLATPPTGFLLMNGQSFNPTTYPKLALAYPALVLPDLRAEFIRGWDNGRGVDVGRVLLSKQDPTGVGYSAGNDTGSAFVQVDKHDGIYAGSAGFSRINATTNVGLGQTLFKVRPGNIAFNYIVRAA